MSNLGHLFLAFVIGLGLGLFYFGGLWLTVRLLPTTRWPVFLTMASLLGRMAVVLLGFYLVLAGHWERLVACVVGFTLMRFVVGVWIRPANASASGQAKEHP